VTLEMQESAGVPHRTDAMVPAAAQAFAAASAMVTLYVDPDPGVPAASTQSVYVSPCPFECTLHMPAVQHGVLMQVVRFDSHPVEGLVEQWPKPVLHVSVQVLLQVPLIALQQVGPPQTTDPGFSV
jgi:hypothetical protein